MGERDDGSQELLGRLDAMRIWNLVRSDADICSAAGREVCP